ncbi:MAG: indolepyruvate oxidoreductase subunit beta [Candidatus Thorarchaeota archaeon]
MMDTIMRCNTTSCDIVLSGIGGQGVLTLAQIIARAALADSLNVRVGEIHGMAQRGGHVVCTVRIGDSAFGPQVDVGCADLLVGFEPVETLREINLLKPEGYVIMNRNVVTPVAVSMGKARYPTLQEIRSAIDRFTHRVVELEALTLARSAGSEMSANVVLLGAVVGTGIVPLSMASVVHEIESSFSAKYLDVNRRAFELGLEESKRVVAQLNRPSV